MQPEQLRVLRVEFVLRDKVYGGHRREFTEADVRTPLGDIWVSVPGYHAERRCYPVLIAAAANKAWSLFCEASSDGYY